MSEPEAVLASAVAAYRATLGPRLLAAYALGSLAHGGFNPLVSDIDVGLVLADPLETGDAATIEAVAAEQKRSGPELAERLSVFWGTHLTLSGKVEGGRFPPLDRLDLIAHGRLLAGTDARAGLPQPSADELLISGAEFALGFLAGAPTTEELRDPDLLIARGVRRVTKLVLFPVRFMYTAATAQIGTNDAAADWYRGVARPLVSAARDWRADGLDERTALLHEQLVPLYREYMDDHIERLRSRPDLASEFAAWREELSNAPG
ncbi:MAG: hypothetical protein J2O48_00540 [Solirubrobacterales bacterium]|nr:hypothetical protein [Solirubrobacterales bacterium]